MGCTESHGSRTPRKPSMHTYAERLGIDPSIIRQYYALSNSTGTFSTTKKSRHCLTIRKNKKSASTAGSSSSYSNRSESSQSNNVGKIFNMIPCFPISSDTDAHHLDTVSNPSSPSHFTKDIPFNISQVRTRSTMIQKNYAMLGKSQRI